MWSNVSRNIASPTYPNSMATPLGCKELIVSVVVIESTCGHHGTGSSLPTEVESQGMWLN